MVRRKINNGVICISNNFVYQCPLKLNGDYKNIIVSLFYNDYSMHLKNILSISDLKEKIALVSDEYEAGLLAADYGYLTAEYKGDEGFIYLPELFNLYQLNNILDEIISRQKLDYTLFIQSKGQSENISNLCAHDLYGILNSTYSNFESDSKKVLGRAR